MVPCSYFLILCTHVKRYPVNFRGVPRSLVQDMIFWAEARFFDGLLFWLNLVRVNRRK